MTRAEAVKAIEAAEAQQLTVSAEWKTFQAGWNPEWPTHPDADRFRATNATTPKKPDMTPGEAAFHVEEARRQLAAFDAGPAIEAARRAAAKVEAAKAKVDVIVADAERKLAAVRREFLTAMEEFNDLWRKVPEQARDLLPSPLCVVSPYADLSIVRTIAAKP